MIKRLFAVLAAAILAFAVFALAPVSAANAQPGQTWSETLPSGERVEFQRTAEGWDVTTHPLTKRDLFSCSTGYWCGWNGTNYTGTFGRYWANNIYSNTAGGVAHCYNLIAAQNNLTRSWANFSTDRQITVTNWTNCNTAGGYFVMTFNSHWDCANPGAWCGNEANGDPRATALRASA